MIVVSSCTRACEAYRRYAPEYVVSILGADEGPVPTFEGLPRDNQLVLRDDCSAADPECGGRCKRLLALAAKWDGKRPILIHCVEGACRSMAVAYILLCAVSEAGSEDEIARRLREAAPHADPNLLLVSEADALLGRNDRMVEAVLDMVPSAGGCCGDIITLPLAA